jgi:hypothetical protein
MLHGLGFRELKVARRSKEGPLFTARKREGSLELRYAVRVLKGNQPVERRQIQDTRRELQQSGANLGLVLTAGEARSDAKSECTSGALVLLWAGEGLSDKFFEAQVGVTITTVELYDIDEAFFAQRASTALVAHQEFARPRDAPQHDQPDHRLRLNPPRRPRRHRHRTRS